MSGRLATVVHPGGATTEVCYDERGRRSATLSPDGALTTYRWSDAGRLLEITRTTADGGVWRLVIEHDPFGMLRCLSGDDHASRARSTEAVLLGERALALVESPRRRGRRSERAGERRRGAALEGCRRGPSRPLP